MVEKEGKMNMENREVYLVGDINAETIEKARKRILKLLKENPKEEITLLISSGGGGGSPAIIFYEWVKLKNVPLTTVAIGEVSSAATIVFLSGKKRKATPHSWFTFHKGGSLTYEIKLKLLRIISPTRYRDETDWMKIYKEMVIKIVQKETRISEAAIREAVTKAHLIFTPEEAQKVGLIQEILRFEES